MAPRRTTLEDYERRVLRAQRVLESRLDDDVSPTELARAAHFSLHHFHRIFRAQLGETVMEHVRRLRLERAARRLRTSDDRILAIAVEAGYESHEAFTRAFAARFGRAPSEFRDEPSARVTEWTRSRPPRPPAVTVAAYPAIRIAFVRHRGGYAGIEATWERLVGYAGPRGLLGGATLYGVCPDDPDVTAEEHLRFDAGVAVEPSFDAAPLETAEIPAGTFAVGLHVGPYERLSETYLDVIGYWFPSSGYELAPDAVVEHYLNDPSTAKPEDLRTEVRVRIAD